MLAVVRKALLLAALAFALAVGMHGRALDRRAELPPEVDVLYVPPAEQLAWMSLGYREALADLVWIRALIFSGDNLGKTDIASVDRYVDAVTGLAPRFQRPYLWGGITAIYGGQKAIDRDAVDRAIGMYRRGIAQFPESHELLYAYGMLLTQQVASTPGYHQSEREAHAAEGIEAIRRAAAFGADPLVRQYAATLVAEHADEQLAIQFLESQLAQAKDEDHRRLLRRKLSQLGGAASIERVETIRETFAREHERAAPYLPDGVYAIVRDEHGPGR
jgi:hypothetical protein